MPDFVSKCTNQAYYLVEAIVVKSLQNPAWVFRGNVVSHMGHIVMRYRLTNTLFNTADAMNQLDTHTHLMLSSSCDSQL